MAVPTESSLPSLRHLVGKLVLIVGGSSGVGLGVAQASLEHGAKVIIASSKKEKVDAAVTKLVQGNKAFEGSISGMTVDATSPSSIQKLLDDIGKFDHLIWTAGDAVGIPNFMEQDIAAWNARPNVRFISPAIAVQYAVKKDLFNPGGSVILTCGTVARQPVKGFAMFAAGAGGIEAFARGLALDIAPVRVNAVAPGAVITEMWEALPPPAFERMKSSSIEKSPLRRVGVPAEIAEAYLFLMKCPMMTGHTIFVENGVLLT